MDRMVTYRRADGEPVDGDCFYVLEPDEFDEPTDVIREEWVRVEVDEMRLGGR